MPNPEKVSLCKILAGAQLPALPQSAIRLLELSQNPDHGPAEFAVPIESDPGLTSQVLRFVNSSYFGFRQEIASVKQAISLVGTRTIKNFALWSAVFSLMPNPRCGPFELQKLWQDSLRRGIFARRLGKLAGSPEAEDLFATSLLQDMAIPLLAKELPEQYQLLLQARNGGMHRLSDLERERFGWTHGEAGAVIAKSWHLPESFATVISKHAQLDESSIVSSSGKVNFVGLSALLPTTCDNDWVERDRFLVNFDKINLAKPLSVQELFEQIDQEFVEFAPVLKLSQPTRSLSEFLAAEPVAL